MGNSGVQGNQEVPGMIYLDTKEPVNYSQQVASTAEISRESLTLIL